MTDNISMEYIAIIVLGVLLGVERYFSYKEHIQQAKINKAKNVSEVEYMFGSKKDEEIEDEVELLPLEAMPDDPREIEGNF